MCTCNFRPLLLVTQQPKVHKLDLNFSGNMMVTELKWFVKRVLEVENILIISVRLPLCTFQNQILSIVLSS